MDCANLCVGGVEEEEEEGGGGGQRGEREEVGRGEGWGWVGLLVNLLLLMPCESREV